MYQLPKNNDNKSSESKCWYVNKTNELKDCGICHYWYFLDAFLSFNQMSAMVAMMYHLNREKNVLMSMSLSNMTILKIKAVDYRCIISGITKSETINVMQWFLPVKKNFRYFIGYLCRDYKIKPLHLMLPKTRTYVKSYDGQTKWMYFLIKDDGLPEKYLRQNQR